MRSSRTPPSARTRSARATSRSRRTSRRCSRQTPSRSPPATPRRTRRRCPCRTTSTSNFHYTLDPKISGTGVTAIKSFLQNKAGFCQQFAATMAAMARALGIPAVVAEGYTPGSRAVRTDEYQVTTHDAHAWPMLYFDGVGWVQFEPTPRSSPRADRRAERPAVDEAADPGDQHGSHAAPARRRRAAASSNASKSACANSDLNRHVGRRRCGGRAARPARPRPRGRGAPFASWGAFGVLPRTFERWFLSGNAAQIAVKLLLLALLLVAGLPAAFRLRRWRRRRRLLRKAAAEGGRRPRLPGQRSAVTPPDGGSTELAVHRLRDGPPGTRVHGVGGAARVRHGPRLRLAGERHAAAAGRAAGRPGRVRPGQLRRRRPRHHARRAGGLLAGPAYRGGRGDGAAGRRQQGPQCLGRRGRPGGTAARSGPAHLLARPDAQAGQAPLSGAERGHEREAPPMEPDTDPVGGAFFVRLSGPSPGGRLGGGAQNPSRSRRCCQRSSMRCMKLPRPTAARRAALILAAGTNSPGRRHPAPGDPAEPRAAHGHGAARYLQRQQMVGGDDAVAERGQSEQHAEPASSRRRRSLPRNRDPCSAEANFGSSSCRARSSCSRSRCSCSDRGTDSSSKRSYRGMTRGSRVRMRPPTRATRYKNRQPRSAKERDTRYIPRTCRAPLRRLTAGSSSAPSSSGARRRHAAHCGR